jgi:radical SAM superfamily enzyme YgiQ (UPF0313 family)
MGFQLPLFGATKREKRQAFYSLHPRVKASKFSAFAPKAMLHFAGKYSLPIIEKPEDLDAFDVIYFSLHCFRDFYILADLAKHKRKGQEWIAGGNACATPAPIGWVMDYVYVGDCRAAFGRLLAGERDMEGMYDSRHPDRLVRYVDEDISVEPINPSNLEMSKGCPRRCLFCIHPWRHRYQEAPKEEVIDFIEKYPKMRLGLLSNSTDDVSYYEEISDLLEARGKQNMIVSNAVQSFTEKLAQQRKADMLFGMEGMSERLRWIVNKPIARSLMRDKVALCLRNSGQVKLIYQFNLPGEEARDFAEFEEDVRHFLANYSTGKVELTFIPNQPSAHTPFQWVVPRYEVAMRDRLTELRKELIGSHKRGLGVHLGTPLGPQRWFAQVIAEWIPITPTVAAAVQKLPPNETCEAMAQYLDTKGITLPPAFFNREEHTVFPWANILTTGDDPEKFKRFQQMRAKLTSPRFAEGATT